MNASMPWTEPVWSCHLCAATCGSSPCLGRLYRRHWFRDKLDIALGQYAWYRHSTGGAWVSYWVDCVAGPCWQPAAWWRPSHYGVEHAIRIEYNHPDYPPADMWEDPDR